jgi:hypothetical protein
MNMQLSNSLEKETTYFQSFEVGDLYLILLVITYHTNGITYINTKSDCIIRHTTSHDVTRRHTTSHEITRI